VAIERHHNPVVNFRMGRGAYHSCLESGGPAGVKSDTVNGSVNTPIQVSGMNRLSALKALTDIPRYFCWTRFGTEAGQTIAQIIERTERERIAGCGMFLWGIGNAIGPSIIRLLQVSDQPEALFSPISSAPRQCDTNPSATVAWTEATGVDGEPFRLPEHALVTSRYDPASAKLTHYALICYSEQPLALSKSGSTVRFQAVRNLVSQRPVGASQTTAIVEFDCECVDDSRSYDVAMRVRLIAPYFICLHHPVSINSGEAATGNQGALPF
jgi:hypothetical protein